MPSLQHGDLELVFEFDRAPSERGCVVLVHGLGCQLIQWPQPLIQQFLETGYSVLRFDNRDAGLSRLKNAPRPRVAGPLDLLRWRLGQRLPAPYTLEDMAADVLALLDHLDLTQVHLVGVSMGGMIAQEIAIRQPHRLHSLGVIMSSSGRRSVGQPRLAVMKALLSPPPSRERAAIVEHIVGQWRLQQGSLYPSRDEDIRASVEACLERGMSGAGFLRQVQAIMNAPNREPRLRQVKTPTLVVHGTDDPLVHCSGGKAVARAIPDARLELIEGWGHDWPPSVLPRLADLLMEHIEQAAHTASPLAEAI